MTISCTVPFLKRAVIDPDMSITSPTLATNVSRFLFFNSTPKGFAKLTSFGAFSNFFSKDTLTAAVGDEISFWSVACGEDDLATVSIDGAGFSEVA